jgi:hypothetical protein
MREEEGRKVTPSARAEKKSVRKKRQKEKGKEKGKGKWKMEEGRGKRMR